MSGACQAHDSTTRPLDGLAASWDYSFVSTDALALLHLGVFIALVASTILGHRGFRLGIAAASTLTGAEVHADSVIRHPHQWRRGAGVWRVELRVPGIVNRVYAHENSSL